jgi:hypothetical protein
LILILILTGKGMASAVAARLGSYQGTASAVPHSIATDSGFSR